MSKRCPTHAAREWLFLRVNLFVACQVRTPRKCFRASPALIWLFTRVNPLVRKQVTVVGECFGAEATVETPVGVCPFVTDDVVYAEAGVRAQAASLLLACLLPTPARPVLWRRVLVLGVSTDEACTGSKIIMQLVLLLLPPAFFRRVLVQGVPAAEVLSFDLDHSHGETCQFALTRVELAAERT